MIRTAKQYVKSLNDGRVIYLNGERIPDVTKHPAFRGSINSRALAYEIMSDPKYRDLFTVEEKGDRYSFFWKRVKTREDLTRRREALISAHEWDVMMGGMGPDSLAAAGVVTARMDKALGTHYSEAIEDYREHLKKTDPAITGAITDVKGDRSLRPMAQQQHKDFYVRVVDRQKDGIVVSGAKIHISATPTANELMVQPCRTHREEDKDYAVVFATPVNAPGITLLTSPGFFPETGEEAQWNWPVYGRGGGISECMIVFENVFVPWNRVFMCGEWQFSREMAWQFGNFHRLSATIGKQATTEQMAGVAALMAEYNGVEKATHIQEKLAWLAMHAEIVNCFCRMAVEYPDYFPDVELYTPNLLYTNIAKYVFANDMLEAAKRVWDITGGIAQTVYSYRDWMNPEERPLLEKYLAGKAGVPTEHRLRAIRLAKDVSAHDRDKAQLHTEGSLSAQIMAVYATAPWEKYKAVAKRIAGIPGWEKHPNFKDSPPHPARWVI